MAFEFIEGNEAIARAAVRAGCDFFAGYPITPASSILHYMNRSLPGAGGMVIQAEDEIASMGFCIAAAMAGRKVMTATSGPGISLYSENIGLAIMGEVPMVIVNIQRQGPATGSATKGAEGDIQFTRWVTSGGQPVIALSPASAEEAYELCFRAFNLAEAYRTPVFLLASKEIGVTKESVDLESVALPERVDRRLVAAGAERYRPHHFERPEEVPAFSPFGGEHFARFTTSTHDMGAYLTTDPPTIQQMIDHYHAKIEAAGDEIALTRADLQPGAETLVLSYGVTSRAAAVAVRQARERGRKVSALVLQTLFPVPRTAICAALDGVRRVVVPEMNMGQYVLELERLVPGGVEVVSVGKMDTTLLSPSEILERGGAGMSATQFETYINPDVGALPFCKGCGHERVARALDRALVSLQLDPRETVLVTDIGCIGLTCKHFVTNAFHGLHGRSITYACGLKLARPELTVIAIKGDGACGIGGTHLLNVARRNIGITLLVADNFNYGMTGGQHSVTTPMGGKTSDTPWGNVEAPMDLCATAVAAGAAWVHRATAFDEDLAEVIAQAISQPGFAMVDVWELCTAYYQPKNELKKKGLFELLESHGLQTGRIVDRPRAEYSEHYREFYKAGSASIPVKPAIEPRFRHSLERPVGILIAGSAGQKIKSTATLLAEGGIFAGLHATQKDDYPITVQTGHSVAEIILAPERIEYTRIDEPDHVVLLSEDGVRRIRRTIEGLPASCTLHCDATLELPATKARRCELDLASVRKQVGPLNLAAAAMGAMLTESGLYPLEAMACAIETFRSPEIAARSFRALHAGAGLVGPR